ncbi:MAG: hypothetical protein ATN35_05130 [Epulopiscium sp. Nele67-Bin004]|nr:MAG: hypothetical protein ATN35_05130 [Epulopiscium sp. Nele67-Bin004]
MEFYLEKYRTDIEHFQERLHTYDRDLMVYIEKQVMTNRAMLLSTLSVFLGFWLSFIGRSTLGMLFFLLPIMAMIIAVSKHEVQRRIYVCKVKRTLAVVYLLESLKDPSEIVEYLEHEMEGNLPNDLLWANNNIGHVITNMAITGQIDCELFLGTNGKPYHEFATDCESDDWG